MSEFPQPLLDLSLVKDPAVLGRNRLPMRSTGVFTESIDEARVATSSQWRSTLENPAKRFHELSLDGEWRAKIFSDPRQPKADDLVGVSGADGGWSAVTVPGAITLQGGSRPGDGHNSLISPHYTNVIMPFDGEPPSTPDENPTILYRRSVVVPSRWADRRVVLRLGAAESVAEIFIDGKSVGATTDSRLPSEFEINVLPGATVEIAIGVTRFSAQSWVEDQDQWWHAGIQRSVTLHALPVSSIAQVKALPGLNGEGSDENPWVGSLDLEIRLDGAPRVERGWTVEALVETRTKGRSKGQALASTGQMPVPCWDSSSEAASLISGMFCDAGVVRRTLDVPDVAPWSHETPQLYRTLVVLRNPDGNIAHVFGSSTGFRSLEVADNELLINGRAALIHGVNIHEHNSETGRFVTPTQIIRDLITIKSLNLNAVRCAHYPHDEVFAAVCDEIGLYVVDEANVESHGRQTSLCHDERFTPTIMSRVTRMVERDQHHPSIIIWSLGNESGYGAVHDAAAAWIRRYDPSRPLQYEGPFMHDLYAQAPVSDIVCPMYSAIEDIVAWAGSGRDSRRPLILCEYSHAMGNSNGSLGDYWRAFETTPGLQGGFIWEWTDHGLWDFDSTGSQEIGPTGQPSWSYGGDFGNSPHDANFVCDGLVTPTNYLRPATEEVKFLGRPVSFAWSEPFTASGKLPKIAVTNRRYYSDLSDLVLRWRLLVDGTAVDSGLLNIAKVDPGQRSTLATPLTRTALKSYGVDSEIHLELTASTGARTDTLAKGHVVAREQLTVRSALPPRAGRIVALASDVDTTGSRAPSTIHEPSLLGEWRPTIFRALTDNDGLSKGWMKGLGGNYARWVDALGLDRCVWNPDNQTLTTGTGTAVEVRVEETVRSDRWEHLTYTFDVPSVLADLPRVGIEYRLSASDELGPWLAVKWFCDGPHENYVDRKDASLAGVWSTTVDDTYVDYALPQEHANREGLRWVAIERGEGRDREGLMMAVVAFDPGEVAGVSRPAVSVRRHSDADLWAGSHTKDLVSMDARNGADTWLYLNLAQRGLGTASCGPDALAQYRLGVGVISVTVAASSYKPGREKPELLYRQLLGGDR